MSELIGEIDLPNLVSGGSDPARVLMGLDENHLSSFRTLWYPQLQDAVSQIRDQCTNAQGQLDRERLLAEIGDRNLQDSHWEWDKKWRLLERDLSKVFFVVECDDIPQAFMVIDNASYVCRHPDHSGKNLIYVEYVAVAPWNRGVLVEEPLYTGLGKLLVGIAVSRSIEDEFGGRIGLHSLPQANGFYASACAMTDFGPDENKQGLHYFEMSERMAVQFLSDD